MTLMLILYVELPILLVAPSKVMLNAIPHTILIISIGYI